MKEDFLHYVWKYRLFNSEDLIGTEGEVLEIIKPGQANFDSGPDFFNAKVKINGVLWAGNVEIHLRSSDWERHGHQHDKAYDNVILHVVFDADKKVFAEGHPIPQLSLKNRISEEVIQTYGSLLNSPSKIPCSSLLKGIDEMTVNSTLERLSVERLQEKAARFEFIYERNNKRLDQTFFEMAARNFGFNINSEPMQMLAHRTDIKILAKHKNSLFQTEALLFGQAGLLQEQFEESYPLELQKEYEFLRKKYDLTPLKSTIWKFSKTRPHNFPTVRIAQLAAFLCSSTFLMSKITETENLEELKNLFNAEPAEFWQTRFDFKNKSHQSSKKLSDDAAAMMVINTAAPFLFFYGSLKNEEELKERAVALLQQIDAEKNSVISSFQKLGIVAKDASQSQALITLEKNYCRLKKCLDCSIGSKILMGK